MSEQTDISVVMGTANRAHMLPGALTSLFAQNAGTLRYEVIVVDNASTDRTRDVIARTIDECGRELRYVFEPHRGVSHARNRGIELARSPIVAFMDDDQEAAPGWLAAAFSSLRDNPEVDMVGGPLLPIWDTAPPSWIATREDMGPMSLVNGGDAPFLVGRRRWFCFTGGNFACRRDALVRAGGYSTDYPRSQDREIQLRLMLHGSEGLYVPDMVMFHHVDGRRLTRTHHRRWWRTEGRMRAGYAFEEMFLAPDGICGPLAPGAARLVGVSPAIYRRLLAQTASWAREVLCGRPNLAFRHERRILYLWSYLRRRHELHAAAGHRTGVMQLLREIAALASARLRRRMFARTAPNAGQMKTR